VARNISVLSSIVHFSAAKIIVLARMKKLI